MSFLGTEWLQTLVELSSVPGPSIPRQGASSLQWYHSGEFPKLPLVVAGKSHHPPPRDKQTPHYLFSTVRPWWRLFSRLLC